LRQWTHVGGGGRRRMRRTLVVGVTLLVGAWSGTMNAGDARGSAVPLPPEPEPVSTVSSVPGDAAPPAPPVGSTLAVPKRVRGEPDQPSESTPAPPVPPEPTPEATTTHESSSAIVLRAGRDSVPAEASRSSRKPVRPASPPASPRRREAAPRGPRRVGVVEQTSTPFPTTVFRAPRSGALDLNALMRRGVFASADGLEVTPLRAVREARRVREPERVFMVREIGGISAVWLGSLGSLAVALLLLRCAARQLGRRSL
jgi:hypothetical protein